MNGSEG
ncbi:hypothetical protein D049_4758A, partial [Vibrio parahaemolyticus VPTS-2010]